MQTIYEKLHHIASNTFDLDKYKKEVFETLPLEKEMQTYDFTTLLEDTVHAMWLSEDYMLAYCHESFWLHIQNQIQKTQLHSYESLFDNEKVRNIFEDWIYELDIDLNRIHETSLLFDIIENILEMIDFTDHDDLLNDINAIQKECKIIAC